MLQDLIKYGGWSEVDKVIIERKARIPRHPVYIVVFAFCEKTKNPDSVWKSGFYCLFFFKVVPPGIVIYSQVVEYHFFLKATQR